LGKQKVDHWITLDLAKLAITPIGGDSQAQLGGGEPFTQPSAL
jgi:hypothetical protein